MELDISHWHTEYKHPRCTQQYLEGYTGLIFVGSGMYIIYTVLKTTKLWWKKESHVMSQQPV